MTTEHYQYREHGGPSGWCVCGRAWPCDEYLTTRADDGPISHAAPSRDSTDPTQATRALIEEAEEMVAVLDDGADVEPGDDADMLRGAARTIERIVAALKAVRSVETWKGWVHRMPPSDQWAAGDSRGLVAEAPDIYALGAAISRAEPDTEEEDTDNGK